jgi:hypothetical protein
MSERWKYQLRFGGFWGIFMTVFSVLSSLQENTVKQQLTSGNFYIRLVGYFAGGIFILGYINWRYKQKQALKTQSKDS